MKLINLTAILYPHTNRIPIDIINRHMPTITPMSLGELINSKEVSISQISINDVKH